MKHLSNLSPTIRRRLLRSLVEACRPDTGTSCACQPKCRNKLAVIFSFRRAPRSGVLVVPNNQVSQIPTRCILILFVCRSVQWTCCPASGQRQCVCAAAGKDVQDAWTKAQQHLQRGEPYRGIVQGVNRGGVLVDCWGVQGARSSPSLSNGDSPWMSLHSALSSPPSHTY
jgi:hypothetical protein